jgi:hypothetical protein
MSRSDPCSRARLGWWLVHSLERQPRSDKLEDVERQHRVVVRRHSSKTRYRASRRFAIAHHRTLNRRAWHRPEPAEASPDDSLRNVALRPIHTPPWHAEQPPLPCTHARSLCANSLQHHTRYQLPMTARP